MAHGRNSGASGSEGAGISQGKKSNRGKLARHLIWQFG